MPWHLACWCILTRFWLCFCHGLLIFLIFMPSWFSETSQIWGFRGLKYDMLIYSKHLWNWLHFDDSLLNILILVAFLANFSTWKVLSYQMGEFLTAIYWDFSIYLCNNVWTPSLTHFTYSVLLVWPCVSVLDQVQTIHLISLETLIMTPWWCMLNTNNFRISLILKTFMS